ncbi:MAG TPA: tyrosine-type recombinase/integrase [Acidimicrobiales bacterium]|nr:tyrosine-type recombinase/integrase [Acidimicrobiales bacterium]
MPLELSVEQSRTPSGELLVRVGHDLLDDYLTFLAGRARPNSVLAAAFDLKVFFCWVQKEPSAVTGRDVVNFIAAQRAPRTQTKVVRISDGSSGLSSRTVARRLSSISGLFAYLVVRGDAGVNGSPVPRGLINRRARRNGGRATPLIRRPVLLPRILEPSEVDRLIAALRTRRDRAMAEAMVLGGLRRCEVLGLRLGDLRPGERKVFVVDGKGGRQRIVPMSPRFFTTVAAYLTEERPAEVDHDFVFVVLKGKRRGQPLSAYGLDEILELARDRAGLSHGSCHELRHTCFTRLREAGMALEAVQAQAGHASIETTRLYLHLADDWLAGEYRRASEAIDAQALAVAP